VQVARLAGLPDAVIERARDVLHQLESGERQTAAQRQSLIDDLPLFRVAPAPAPAPKAESQVEKRLTEISPDELSPREALAALYELKSLLQA
jgi:DNA mismatch repair protein MutS